MKKFICLLILFSFSFISAANAENLDGKAKVSVMDFGQHSGAIISKLLSDNIGMMSSDYIIEALIESGRFVVISKELAEEKLVESGLKPKGIISPSVAKSVGEILGVQYVIYGNVNGMDTDSVNVEILFNGGKFHAVKAKIAARMMKVSDGSIVTSGLGEGVSKSSELKVGYEKFGFFKFGKSEIPQVSVHNAIKKAAYSSVDIMIERLFNIPKNKNGR